MDFDATKIPPNLNDMARNLWSQLDSMAKNNPRGYKELMSKIEEEAKKTLIPVLPTIEPCFSIKLEGTIISGSKVHYINFCKCNAVEESTKENDGGIPIVVREEDGKRKYRKYGRTFHVYDVSFNENILKRAEADPFFKRNLIFMAINCVEQVFNISFKKDFTVTEEKYNGTFIHGHTSREGQPMPKLSQEEVNELLKNASSILNQTEEKDGKEKKNKNKKNTTEKPINMTPESILKEHKTYQEEMKENENNDKINPEIESTMEKLFFSDEKKEDSKDSKNSKKIVEEMTEIIPESKKTEHISEEAVKSSSDTKNEKKEEQKNQFIELEGNGIPKIIDLLDDYSNQKQKDQNENKKEISEAESKIFDFLKDFDDHTGSKITELDESNNEVPPSKIEELSVETPSKIEEIKEETPAKTEKLKENKSVKIEELNDNVTKKMEELKIDDIKEKISSKIEELKEGELPEIIEELHEKSDKLKNDDSNKINEIKEEKPNIEELEEEKLQSEKPKIDETQKEGKNDVTPKIEEISHDQYLKESIDESDTTPKVEEPSHTEPIIEEPPTQNTNESSDTEKFKDKEEHTPIIEEITHETMMFSNIKEETNNDNSSPRIEDVTHDEEISSKLSNNEENDDEVIPKIEEPPHCDETTPIVEEPIQTTEDTPIDGNLPRHDSTPIIEEIIHKNEPISAFTDLNEKTEKILNDEKEKDIISDPGTKDENNNETLSTNKNEEISKHEINNQNNDKVEKIESILDKKINEEKLEKKDEIHFKTITLPEKEKPKYLLKTTEHYFYIKIKLPKLKLIKTLKWNFSNCEADEQRPETEKWLKVNSPEYDLHIRIDMECLDPNSTHVSFAKSTKTLVFRFNRKKN
jgi:hypothetical protein